MTKRFRCAPRWPVAMASSGLALLMIGVGVLSFVQHHKLRPGSVRQVQAADTAKNIQADQPQATLADVAASVTAVFRTDAKSSDPTSIDDNPSAGRTETESEPPMAVNEAPTDPRTSSETPTLTAGPSAAALPAPIQAGKDAVAPAATPEPVAAGGDFGTALTFAQNPAGAAMLAKRNKKLAFFLHVSGNFEDSGCT